MFKSKTKKIIMYFIFVSLTFIVGTFKVMAENGSIGSGSGGPAASCTSGWCWHDMEAIRISIYNKDGIKLGKSLNFYNSNQEEEAIDVRPIRYFDTTFMAMNKNYSKYDYIKGNYYIPSYSNWFPIGFRSYFSGGIDFIKNLYETGYSNNVLEEKIGLSTKEQILEKLKKYEGNFSLGSITFEKMYSEGTYYMLIEPITIIQNGNRLYIGTYYELQQIYNDVTKDGTDFGGAKSLFYSNYKVSDWGDAKLAMSMYLDDDSVIKVSGTFKDTIDSYKNNKDFFSVNNGYGMSVLWLSNDSDEGCNESSPDWNPITQSCEFNVTKDECEVLEPTVEPCSGRIIYEYQNCPTSGYNSVEYYNATACDIRCNEKYYVSTYALDKSFNPINGGKILAGTYFQVIGPTVYHKKVCDYVRYISDEEIDKIKLTKEQSCITYKTKTGSCSNHTGSETCSTLVPVTDESCMQAVANAAENAKNGCKNLKKIFDNLNSDITAEIDINNQKKQDINVNTGFSEYVFTSKVINKEINKIDEVNYEFGYRNSIDYELINSKDGNTSDNYLINRFIGLESIKGITNITQESYYDFGKPMVTTVITLKSGEYNYSVNYNNLFNQQFKDIIKQSGKYDIDRDLQKVSCPYNIEERNIKTYCTPDSTNNYCGDPDTRVIVPKIKMIYRPINLNYPFPGKDGKGRTPGSNWNKESIEKYITKNRGVETNKVFEQEPIYVIKLDTKTIKAIREYNKNHAYDDFTLKCTEGKGTECLSSFLRGTASDFNKNLITSGTCKDITTDTFDSCRYLGNKKD